MPTSGFRMLIHSDPLPPPHRPDTSFSPPTAFPFPVWLLRWLADEPCCRARWRLPCLSVYFQARRPARRQAGRQAGSQSGGVVEGRGVDACVREALSHIPPAAGSRPGLWRGGFASFSRPLKFLRSSGSYSFPARN